MNEARVKACAKSCLMRLNKIQTGITDVSNPEFAADFVESVNALLSEVFTREELAEISKSLV